MELEADLRAALEREELEVAYQPIFSLRAGSLTGFEALARWNHPVHGPVGPAEFIRVAEESGLILDLGRWVMTKAVTQARDWAAQFPERGTLEMSVNVSARQLRQPGMAADVLSTLAATGLDPACLVVELTESMLMDDTEPTIEKLQQLRGRGVKVAIDDFGTGYSSLSYLVRLPVDKLKIDRSFVVAMGAGAEESALVRAIVTMGHLLGLTIVAEGIETEEQRHALKAAGSDLGQGYLLGRPVSAAVAEQWLVPDAAAVTPADVG
jgi:EAL domain-containing protein (putative c-di-GMP-specific phosphodiesterase class I)